MPSRYLGRDRPVPLGAVRAALLALRVRQISRGVLGELADTDLIAAAPLVDGLSEQQELVGGEDHHKLPEGVLSSHIDLSHAPDPPEGCLSPNIDSCGHSDKFSVWLGRAWHSGGLSVPELSPVI